VTRVPSKFRNCTNAQNHQSICAVKSHSCALATFLIWYRIYIAQPWNVSLIVCLHGCEIACALKQTFAKYIIFLQGHCWWLTSRTCVKTLINETSVKYEAITLSICDIAIHLEEPHTICRRPAVRPPLVQTYVAYHYQQSQSHCMICQNICVQ